MAETAYAPPTEATQQTPPPSESTDRTKLGDVLRTAAEQGQQRQEASREKWSGRRATIREAAKAAWTKTREKGKEIDAKVRGITTPEARAVAGTYLHERADAAQEAVRDRSRKIADATADRADAVVEGFMSGMRATRDAVGEHVVRPTVDRARTIADSVAAGVDRGALFTVDAAKSGAEAVVRGKDAAVAKSKEWGNRLTAFTKRQGEHVASGVRKGKDSFVADYHEAQAQIADKAEARGEKAADRASRRAERSRARAARHEEKATTYRTKAAEIRAGSSPVNRAA